MAAISRRRVRAAFNGLNGATTTAQGRALEDMICYLFSRVRGIEIVARNTLNVFRTEEIDVAVWNSRLAGSLDFLPHTVLIECKNWSQAVGSQEVVYFAQRLKDRGCEFGILVATNGITGDPTELTRAHMNMTRALSEGRRILVVTRADLEALGNSDGLVRLLKRKICELVVSGTTLN